jgi:hypothetical protein
MDSMKAVVKTARGDGFAGPDTQPIALEAVASRGPGDSQLGHPKGVQVQRKLVQLLMGGGREDGVPVEVVAVGGVDELQVVVVHGEARIAVAGNVGVCSPVGP